MKAGILLFLLTLLLVAPLPSNTSNNKFDEESTPPKHPMSVVWKLTPEQLFPTATPTASATPPTTTNSSSTTTSPSPKPSTDKTRRLPPPPPPPQQQQQQQESSSFQILQPTDLSSSDVIMQVFFNNATSKNGVTTDIYPALEQNPLGSAALLQYHVYFPSNNNTKFDWGSKGGLLPGLGYGAAAVGGCGPWDAGVSCWSVQLGWNPDGTGKIVAALPAPEQLDTFWNRVKVDGQDPETGAIIMANGTFTWKKNVWNKVGLLVIMNKVGGTDGYIELMVNDMLVFKVEVVVHRLNPDVEPDSVMLQFAYNQVPVSYDHNSTIGKVPSLNNSSNSNTSPNLMAMLKGMQLQIITPPAPPPPPPPPSPPPPSPPPPPPRQLCSFEVNVDYYGGDIKMLGNVSSSASCCNACRTTPNCAAWTYIWTKNCYLKYAGQYVKRQMYNNEYVSGVVQLQDNSLFLDDLGDGLSSLSSSLQGVCLPSQELREAAGRARATGTAKRGISIGPSSPFQLLSSSSSLEGETIVESMSISSNGDIKKFTSSSSSTPPPTDKNISIKDPCSEEQQLLQLLVAGTWWHDWKLVPHRQDLKSGNSIQTTASMLDIEYVPTVESHYASNGLDLLQTIVDSLQTQLFPAARHLMGFPAPNLQSGAAMTPEEAAALWPVIQAATDKTVILSGEGDKDGEGGNKQHQQLLLPVRLGSPIVTTCGSDCIEDYASPFDWLDAFFSLCKGCRVDFIAFSVKSCTIDGLQAQLLEMRRYGKPLWITNLACPSHATTTFNNRPMMTPLVLNAMLDVLDNDYYVERYAISSGYIGSDITDGRGAGGAGAGGEEGMPVIGRSGDDNGSSNIIDKIWRAPGSTEPSSLEEEEEEEKRSSSRDRTTTVVNKILPRRDNRQWTEMCQPCLFADLELQDEVVKLKCGNLCGLWVGEQDGKVGGGGSSNIIPL